MSATRPEPSSPPTDRVGLPTRYEIRERDDRTVLVCLEAPAVAVHVRRGLSFSEQESRRLPERSILLDGVGTFAPLVDDGSHLYNLDHHVGCSRAFTLATCEQALVLVVKGLELDRGEWTLYANEPDLDTIFAIWVLLNYRRLRQLEPAARDRIAPLLRLEGAIDANGFALAEWCGLPSAELARQRERLDQLHRLELEVKRSGQWLDGDLVAYTRDMLVEIDHLVYDENDFSDFEGVQEEYDHVEIGQGKVAVTCRDDGGIYDVERRLKKTWGDRLGIIALEREPRQWTLRRSASLSGIELQDAYDRLNLLDPAVDGRPVSKRWGGSDEIGGSPRPDGTGLTPSEISKILKLTYKRVPLSRRLRHVMSALMWAAVLCFAAGLAVVALRFFGGASAQAHGQTLELAIAAGVFAVGAAGLTRHLSRGWYWLYGWTSPAGREWILLAPLVAAAAALGALPIPAVAPTADRVDLAWAATAVLLAALAVELCFRGLVHGLLVLDARVQLPGGTWRLGMPVWIAALGSTALVAAVQGTWLPMPTWLVGLAMEPAPPWAVLMPIALAGGLLAGMMRERSLSLWPCVVAMALGGLLRLLGASWPLFG
ncbi:MAG: hypothetical protein AAGN46_03745 [Acidobacteriota bacterium]